MRSAASMKGAATKTTKAMNVRPTDERMLNGRLLFQTALKLVLDSRITQEQVHQDSVLLIVGVGLLLFSYLLIREVDEKRKHDPNQVNSSIHPT
jgi:hypothetical protein